MNRYILFYLLISCSRVLVANEMLIESSQNITLNNAFSTIEIYNTLTDSDIKENNDIVFELHIKNNSDKDQQLYLSFINPTLDRILVSESQKKSQILGDKIPFTKREFKHVNHVYPFLLKKDSSTIIRAHIYNNKIHPLNVRVNLSTENNFIKTTNHDNFFNGVFYGIFFLYLMLLICFYIFSKSNFFSIYLAINIFTLILFMQYNGSGYQFIWFYSSTVQKYITIVASIGYLTAHILFIRTFFSVQLKNLSRYVFRIFLLVITIFGLLLLLQLYNHAANSLNEFYPLLVQGIFISYGILVILLCIYAYAESKGREILWVLTGMVFHLVNWVIFINNEFASITWINKLDNFKLFSSDIFVPQLNYYFSLLEIFVVTIFIAINYHKLIRQNNLSSQRLEFLQKRNINTFVLGQEEERSKITKEIELEIFKDITALQNSLKNLHLQQDEKKIIPTVLYEIDKTLTDINNITGNYVAPDMQQMKLTELILTATDKLFQEINTDYNFDTIPENFKLNSVANINIYRVFQEISNNALKHSKANNINISAIKDNKSLQIKIKDDGVGFVEMSADNKGIGLMNIESRMSSLNGNFYLLSNQKKGTTIHLIMSLKDIL